MTTSYQQALNRRWKYPQLWRGCVGAWCPELGVQGSSLYDWSGNGAHGTFSAGLSASAWALGNGLNSIQFPTATANANIKINAPSGTPLSRGSGDWSLSLWVYYASSPISNVDILASFDGNGVSYTGTGSGITLLVQDNALWKEGSSGSVITAGQLNHYCLTRTGSTYAIYRNGASVGSSYANNGWASTGIYYLGRPYGGNASYASGASIGDVRFYNRVVSQNEIQLLYSNGAGRGVAYTQKPLYRYNPASTGNRRRRVIMGAA